MSSNVMPWEQQHISKIKVVGVVREVIPISFREIHFVVDCDMSSSSSSGSPTSPTSPSSSSFSSQQQPPRQKNWVDVHATGTWAARCAILAVGDKVQLQYFGVYRPVTSKAVAEHLNNQSHQNRNNGNRLNNQTTTSNNSNGNETIQYWNVPESRKLAAPFVLSPIVSNSHASSSNNNQNSSSSVNVNETSTFVVERGQQLILHDNNNSSNNQDDNNMNENNKNMHQEELNVRTQGSYTPQQLFLKSVQNSSSNSFSQQQQNNNNNTSEENHQLTTTSKSSNTSSIGNSIGKNLFSNVFRFVDVMRGLNTNLLPLLRKIQKVCAGAQHVLDAGCGSGIISFAIKCSDPNGPEIVATDRSRAMSALVQEKNQTFAGLMASASYSKKNTGSNRNESPPHRSNSPSKKSSRSHHHDQNKNESSNNNTSNAPLVQFVLGDLSASPDRFIILPGGASATEVAVGGRKQFDVLLCIDVLSFLPSIEAMKRALFNLALHAKPKAKLILSVPNLLSCAEDAIKLQQQGVSVNNNGNDENGTSGNSNQIGSDYENRPKTQRALHFSYDRHKLSLGSSSFLSQGGVLDVVERQYFDMLNVDGGSSSSKSVSSPNINKKDSSSTNSALNDSSKKLLRRYTEWFGFSCPNNSTGNYNNNNNTNSSNNNNNFHPNTNTGASSPQIFYESLEELIFHPSFLESLFEDMGWKVQEVWLFDALERGGEFADPGVNTLAVLGAVPGGSSANGLGSHLTNTNHNNNNASSLLPPTTSPLVQPQTGNSPTFLIGGGEGRRNNVPPSVGFAEENNNSHENSSSSNSGKNFSNAKSAQQIEASFTHRLYTLVRKT